MSLPEIQVRLGEDVLQTLVIGEHFNLSFQQEVSPSHQSMYHCCQLKIMHRIILLRWLQLSRGISNHFLLLHQNYTKTLKRGVAEHLVRFGVPRRNQDWSSGELLFECVEGQLTLWRPSILHTLLEKI